MDRSANRWYIGQVALAYSLLVMSLEFLFLAFSVAMVPLFYLLTLVYPFVRTPCCLIRWVRV